MSTKTNKRTGYGYIDKSYDEKGYVVYHLIARRSGGRSVLVRWKKYLQLRKAGRIDFGE
jgi:hypothetical protein